MEYQDVIPFVNAEIYTRISHMDEEKMCAWLNSYVEIMSELSDDICMLGLAYRLARSFASGVLRKHLHENHTGFMTQTVYVAGKAYASLRSIDHLIESLAKDSKADTVAGIKQSFEFAQRLITNDIREEIGLNEEFCKAKKDTILEILSNSSEANDIDPIDNMSLNDIANVLIYSEHMSDDPNMHSDGDAYSKFVRAVNCLKRVYNSINN